MHPMLRPLLSATPPPAEAVATLLAGGPFPLIAPEGVTFLLETDADAVNLRCWIWGLPTAQPLERIPGTALWVRHLELPAGSRVEYKFEVIRGDRAEWIVDPRNPELAADPFGANSVVQGHGYVEPDWVREDPDARRGTLDEFSLPSAAFGAQRPVQLYLPARFRRSRRYPLLIVHDGLDYLRFARLRTVLDNLIHRLEVAPLVVALTQSPDRLNEYAGDERHARFVGEELLPVLRERLPLDDRPEARGLMGASFGGVASLHAAARRPGTFGRLLLQSGSFAFSDIGEHRRGPVFDPVVRFVNAFRAGDAVPAERIYMSCGIYESLIYENRSLLPLLRERGMEVRYEEARDGHNWQNWRDRLQSGLSWLFPGPLLLVYE